MYIFVKNLRIFARHGVGEQEKLIGNEFTVCLRLAVDFTRAMQTDDLKDTVNYAQVCEAVRAEMQIPSHLLEHVAGRIVRRIFKEFPQVTEAELRIEKRNPPMGLDVEAAGVTLRLENRKERL